MRFVENSTTNTPDCKRPLFMQVGLLFLVILFPNFVTIYFSTAYSDPYNAFCFLVLAILSIAVPILVTKTLRRFFIFYTPFALIAPIYTYYVYNFKSVPSEGIVAAAIRTNPSEVLDLINVYGWQAAGPVIVFFVYVYLIWRSRHLDRTLTSKAKKILIVIFSYYVLAALIHAQYISVHFDTRPIVSESMLRESFPLGVVTTLTNVIRSDHARPNNAFKFHAYKKDQYSEREIYVLIIGESSRYRNWGVNGYARPTSPNLSRLSKQGELISFADMAASSNATIMAVPIIVTRATANNFEIVKTEGSVAAAFREAGFKTGWISNQDNMYPPDTDFSDFRDDWNYQRYDENMLPIVDKALKQHGGKIFLILHTMGNHVDYDHRYPKRFKIYKPTLADLGKPISLAVREALLNSYDNSILATDDFISNVVSLVEAYKGVSAVFFISDHGENLFDDDRNLFMHAGPNPTRYETHIPAFAWVSGGYRARYPEKYRALMEHRKNKVSQDHVFHTLLDIANIGLQNEDLTMSIASEKFIEPANRFILNQHWRPEVYERLR